MPRFMQTKKYADWFTKQEAAQRIGVSVKTVERLADAGKLQQKMRSRPGGTDVAVFHPNDVEREASERAATAGKPFVMPAGATPASAIVPAAPQAGATPAGAMVPAAPQTPLAAPDRDTGNEPTVAIAKRLALLSIAHIALWLRYEEAVAFTGLGESRLRELVEAGAIKTERGPHGSVVLRRADLERHAGTA